MYKPTNSKRSNPLRVQLHYFDRALQNYLLFKMPACEEREQLLQSLREVNIKIIDTAEIVGFHVFIVSFGEKIRYCYFQNDQVHNIIEINDLIALNHYTQLALNSPTLMELYSSQKI